MPRPRPSARPRQAPLGWVVATTVALLHAGLLAALWHMHQPAPVDTSAEIQVRLLPEAPPPLAVTEAPLPPTPEPAPPEPPPEPTAPAPVAEAEPEPPPPTAAAPNPTEPPQPAPPAPAPAHALPNQADVRWHYSVQGRSKGISYNAEAQLHWQIQDTHYQASLEMRLFLLGSRRQTSSGEVGPHGLQPHFFMDQARKERRIAFDWTQHSASSGDATFALPTGTQDRLSLFMQLSGWLALEKPVPPPGHSWTVPVAGFGQVEPWVFRFEGVEPLTLPAGNVLTWKLTRQARHERDQQVELWFAPALHHLPVRIRLSQAGGDEVDQQLQSFGASPP